MNTAENTMESESIILMRKNQLLKIMALHLFEERVELKSLKCLGILFCLENYTKSRNRTATDTIKRLIPAIVIEIGEKV